MDKSFLSVKDLYVEYTSDETVIHAVNGVSFSMTKGETLGLVGETGAGKTTIAKTILRILPPQQSRVTGGSITLNGENLLEKSEEDMRKVRGSDISMIFQDPMTALNPVMTVGDQIAEAILLHNTGITKEEAAERAMQMLETVGIVRQRYHEFPYQLSGGMKQRIVIAMALACNPELLLADEPTTALDVTIQAQILEMINGLKQKLQTSMLLITHDLGIVAQMCDYVAVIYAGKIIEYGTKEDIFDHPSHPYTIGLFLSLPSMAVGESRLHPIEGLPPDPSSLPPGCSFCPRCRFATAECQAAEGIPETEISQGHMCRCVHPVRGGIQEWKQQSK